MNASTAGVVAIFGFSSQIGLPLCQRLQAAGYSVVGVSRDECPGALVPVHRYDPVTRSVVPPLPAISAMISLAPLPVISEVLELLTAGLMPERIIAIGTTGIYSKADSTSSEERAFVDAQLLAEKYLVVWAEKREIGWTLLRPTMIYGINQDRNVAFIRTMFRRFGFFPMPIGARGVRQPVHVDDLAVACVQILENSATRNKAYNLGGGEVLPYEDMVRKIRSVDGLPALLVPTPRSIYYLLILMARLLLGQKQLRTEMVDRMYADLVADNTAASDDFGYAPRQFEPPPG